MLATWAALKTSALSAVNIPRFIKINELPQMQASKGMSK
jgi:hypothetical protein